MESCVEYRDIEATLLNAKFVVGHGICTTNSHPMAHAKSSKACGFRASCFISVAIVVGTSMLFLLTYLMRIFAFHCDGPGPPDQLSVEGDLRFKVLQYNIRSEFDEWVVRRPVLGPLLGVDRADVVNLMESKQGKQQRWTRAQHGGANAYEARIWDVQQLIVPPPGWGVECAGGQRFETGTLMSRFRGIVSHYLVAPNGERVLVVGAHLDYASAAGRYTQAGEVIEFIRARRNVTRRVVLTADMNGNPDEPFYARIRESGLQSAYSLMHGFEPRTYKTGADHTDPYPVLTFAIDYVWFSGLTVEAVELTGTVHVPSRPQLFPSDHFGIRAQFRL